MIKADRSEKIDYDNILFMRKSDNTKTWPGRYDAVKVIVMSKTRTEFDIEYFERKRTNFSLPGDGINKN